MSGGGEDDGGLRWRSVGCFYKEVWTFSRRFCGNKIGYKTLRIIVTTLQDINNEVLGHYPAVLVAPNGMFLTTQSQHFPTGL